MMKEMITDYAAYNVWANENMCNAIRLLSDEPLNREIINSFPSINKTLLHIWDAQIIWMKRLEGVSLSAFPSEQFNGEREEVIDGVMDTSIRLQELAKSYEEEDLKIVKKYTTLRSGIVTSTISQVFMHVFNHSTYHRGQLVTMLRQVGVTELPKGDFIYYIRSSHAV